jgi:hypothetical protein
MKKDNTYEIFIVDNTRNTIMSLDKDDMYFFNTTNFTDDDFKALQDKNIDHLINKGLVLKLDSQMIYRMYLGFVNKNMCVECKKRVGNHAVGKGFGNLPA